jgi:hypothetical protein
MHSLPSLLPFRTIPSFPTYRSRLIRPSRFCCCCHDSYPPSRPPALRLHRELPPITCSSYPGVTAKANAISLSSRDLSVGTSRYKDPASVVRVAPWGIGPLEKQKLGLSSTYNTFVITITISRSSLISSLVNCGLDPDRRHCMHLSQ